MTNYYEEYSDLLNWTIDFDGENVTIEEAFKKICKTFNRLNKLYYTGNIAEIEGTIQTLNRYIMFLDNTSLTYNYHEWELNQYATKINQTKAA